MTIGSPITGTGTYVSTVRWRRFASGLILVGVARLSYRHREADVSADRRLRYGHTHAVMERLSRAVKGESSWMTVVCSILGHPTMCKPRRLGRLGNVALTTDSFSSCTPCRTLERHVAIWTTLTFSIKQVSVALILPVHRGRMSTDVHEALSNARLFKLFSDERRMPCSAVKVALMRRLARASQVCKVGNTDSSK